MHYKLCIIMIYNNINQPTHYKLFLSCRHEVLVPSEDLFHPALVQKRRGAEDLHFCSQCESEINNGAPYLSASQVQGAEKSVFQRVIHATPMFQTRQKKKDLNLRNASSTTTTVSQTHSSLDDPIPFFIQLGDMYSTPQSSPMKIHQ
jgi:hypothetical protein